MKLYKFALATLLALAFAGSASAQTILHLSGGNATRVAVTTAIENLMGGSYKAAYLTGSGVTSEKDAIVGIISGNITNVGAVIFKYDWLGAIGGLKVMATNQTLANSWMANSNLPVSGVVGLASPTYDAAVTADVNYADVFQSSTAYPSPVLVDQIVGVLPLQWVRSAGAPSTITNISSFLAYNAIGGGLPLSQFTGKSSDENAGVYVLGRDESAGARFQAFGESGFGFFSSPQQYQAVITSGQITNYNLYPAQTILGVSYSAGHSGYSSGGTLATVLNTPVQGTTNGGTANAANSLATWFVGYLATTDVAKVTNGAALTWNGSTYSLANVTEGQYSFWSYEHETYRSSLTGLQKTAADDVATQLHNSDIAAGTPAVGILVTSMAVGRTGDGGSPITFGNPYP